jgi:amino acid adenylation domain-containing protein
LDSTADIEDAYPLSPLQQGMLFNTLFDPGSGVDIEQLHCGLHEALDVAAYRRAWQRLVERHPVLRTRLRWEDLGEPRQEVLAHVELPWEEQDWSGAEGAERERRLAEFLGADRRRGIALEHAPLFRLTLLRYGDQEFHFVWTFHHVMLDGGSYAMAFKEVFAFYEAFRQGAEISLALPRPYRDYIDWFQHQDFAKGEAFWRETLKGFAVPTPLVVDHAPVTGQVYETRKGTRELLLSETSTAALRALAQEGQLTLNTVVQGAWAVLLSRYSGESDVLFGVIRANRRSTIEGAESMMGLFLGTLPLRVHVNLGEMLIPWLMTVRAQWMAMREHENTPLATVQAVSDVTAGRPLFHSTVIFENHDLDAHLRQQGGTWSNRRFWHYSQTNYPLDVAAYGGAQLRLTIDFDRTRIDDDAAERMLGHLRSLLEGMARDPHQTLAQLPLLSDSERQELLAKWSGTATEWPTEAPVHELFEAQAVRRPDAAAVSSSGRTISYGELERRSNQLAHALRKRGVGPDVLVGLCVNRTPDMIVAVLGVLKAGGAYVPLDPNYPAERLAFMLQDCGATVLITEQTLRASLPLVPKACDVIHLDTDAAALAAERQDAPRSGVGLADLAYAIYTSGSTGQPKAALVTHRSLHNLAASEIRLYGIAPQSRVLQFASLNFDTSVSEIAMALCSGGTLYVEGRETLLPGRDLERYLERERITVLSLTPSALALLDPAAGSSVEQVVVGGEPCPAELAARWAGRCRFFNSYGPTEATVTTTCVECRDKVLPPLVGRPLPNVRLYVLDQARQPVPVGIPGELYIGGIGVARGYLNRPKLNAERFVPDPFCDVSGARMYRSGDFVRWCADGQLEFIGRIDNQVKIRGFRIELGEIEACIEQLPEVRQVVVMAREDKPGDKRLVAYVVAENPPAGLVDRLRAHLKRSLPEYMVPAAYVTLEELPLTPNDKVDRKALPAPEHSASQQTAYVGPRSLTEEVVAGSWRKALQLERVGVHDNFFELGGHSLMLVGMISEINSRFKIRLGMADLIQNPTLEQFARLLDTQQQQPSRMSKVVPLQEGRSELPVYFIYAGPGELRVAQHMAGSHPVFGVEVRWPMAWRNAVSDYRTSAFPSMEEMVAPYVAEISAHVGTRPCVLAGFCYAGQIAFETAHQLHKLGGKVECVILIDSQVRPPNRYQLGWRILRHAWKHPAGGVSGGRVLQSLGSRITSTWDTSWWLLGKAKKRLRSYTKAPELDLSTLSGVIDEQGMPVPWAILDRLYEEMAKTYRLRSLASRGILFRTGELDGRHIAYDPDDALGWEHLFAKGVEVIPIPGHHFSIWGKQTPEIAREINRVLGQRPADEGDRTGVDGDKPQGAIPRSRINPIVPLSIAFLALVTDSFVG